MVHKPTLECTTLQLQSGGILIWFNEQMNNAGNVPYYCTIVIGHFYQKVKNRQKLVNFSNRGFLAFGYYKQISLSCLVFRKRMSTCP